MQPTDILFFNKYFFTDDRTSEGVNHFALLLLPRIASGYENNIYCAVITSKKPWSKYNLALKKENHKCFKKDVSYVCFDRRDFQCIDDLGKKKPVGQLNKQECKIGFKLLKSALSIDNSTSTLLKGTMIREWQKIL